MASTRDTINKVIKKRARTQISLEVKFKIIQTLEKGEKINHVARLYNLNESTIRTIKKNADAIKMAVKDALPTSSKILKYTRNTVMVKMEKLLIQWIEDNNKKHIGMDTRSIQTKALSIFNQLKKENDKKQNEGNEEEDEEKSLSFLASKGWFDKFKKRYNLHNNKIVSEAATTDKEATTEFEKSFKIFIENNGYNPQQAFNADETGLFWKRLPSRKFISKEEAELTTNDLRERNQEEGEQEKAPDLFTTENIKNYISMIQKAADFIESIDPDRERRGSIRRGLKAQIAPYEFILEGRNGTSRQPTLDKFFMPSTSTATTVTTAVTVEYSSSESDCD